MNMAESALLGRGENDAPEADFHADMRRRYWRLWMFAVVLIALLFALSLLSLSTGSVAISCERVAQIALRSLSNHADQPRSMDEMVVLNIRLPRLLLGVMIGACLAISGAFMQGLFRNPLADPGLLGVSSGAGLGAAVAIVLGDTFPPSWTDGSSFALLPAVSFVGALAATLALYGVATRDGRTSIATMLLAGVALGALSGAFSGLIGYVSNDRQLRDLAFWSLGSFGGATWTKAAVIAPITLAVCLSAPLLSRGLNAIVLGESEAFHLGFRVQRIKSAILLLVAIAVGASVAASGVIGFVGIVAPHAVRLAVGADHRALLPLSALLGACLLTGADVLARSIVAPAELPIGILTAAIGAPFFLWLLLRKQRSLDF